MAALVVPGVCRFAVQQSMFERPIVNILDMKIDSQEIDLTNRREAVRDQAKIIVKEWKARLLGGQSGKLSLLGISWVDLNDASGLTGSFYGDADVTLPAQGGVTGDALTPSTSVLVTKQTDRRRGEKTGRMYLAGAGESDNDSANQRLLKSIQQGALQGAFDGFLSAINQEAGVTGAVYDSDLHVVHVKALAAATSSVVTKLAVQQMLATQRRRLRP